MAHCQLIVGESLLLLVGESTQFTRKNLRKIDKASREWGGQNGMPLCRLIVGESLMLLIGELTQFTVKKSCQQSAIRYFLGSWTFCQFFINSTFKFPKMCFTMHCLCCLGRAHSLGQQRSTKGIQRSTFNL